MSLLRLSIATTDYDHFRDFRLGLVKAEGVDHNWLTLGHHEVFARFTFNREWDVSELSFAKFMAQVTREDPDIIGLPAPPRHRHLAAIGHSAAAPPRSVMNARRFIR
jgi:4,5-dihydroxyphthalate decarboxylase